MVVTLPRAGMLKANRRIHTSNKKRGSGKTAATTREQDFVENLYVGSSILFCVFLTEIYWLKVYQIPQGGRTARGRPLVNLLPLEEGKE